MLLCWLCLCPRRLISVAYITQNSLPLVYICIWKFESRKRKWSLDISSILPPFLSIHATLEPRLHSSTRNPSSALDDFTPLVQFPYLLAILTLLSPFKHKNVNAFFQFLLSVFFPHSLWVLITSIHTSAKGPSPSIKNTLGETFEKIHSLLLESLWIQNSSAKPKANIIKQYGKPWWHAAGGVKGFHVYDNWGYLPSEHWWLVGEAARMYGQDPIRKSLVSRATMVWELLRWGRLWVTISGHALMTGPQQKIWRWYITSMLLCCNLFW